MGEAIGPPPPASPWPRYCRGNCITFHYHTHILFSESILRYKHGHELALATQKCLRQDPGSLVMALDGFRALRFVPPAPEIFAEIRITILHCLLPLIL